jgi:IS5 family transposase
MKQITISEVEFDGKRKRTHNEIFFEKMEKVLPLNEWCGIIRPHYYRKGNGREAISLEIMLKMLLVSKWFNLSDEQTEDMLNENIAAKRYVGKDGDAPDATTLCKFRVFLHEHGLMGTLFAWQTKVFTEKHILLKEGTIVDATIIESADTKKTREDKSIGVTHKNGRFHIGQKMHIGVDKGTNIIHSVKVTPANVADIAASRDVLHGEEQTVYGDAGYTGISNRADICELFQDGTGEMETIRTAKNRKTAIHKKRKGIQFIINRKRKCVVTEADKEAEKDKSRVRIFVEHAFCKIKYIFGYRSTRYRGLGKNQSNAYLYCVLANLLTCSQRNFATK